MRLFLLVIFSSLLSAGTVQLVNDSPYMLRAVIRGADGTYLGEMVLNPEHSNTWSDWGIGGGGTIRDYPASQTPYTVRWYCLDGNDFSFNDNVPTGGTATARNGDGRRMCSPPKQKPGTNPSQPPEVMPNIPQVPQQSDVGPPHGEW